MTRINLIPAARHDARRRRRHARWCMTSCVLYALIAGAGAAACRCAWGAVDPALAVRVSSIADQTKHAQAAATLTRAQLAAVRATLQADRQLTAQPDWSLLLALLSREAGDQIIFHTCALAPRAAASLVAPAVAISAASAKPISHPNAELTLKVTGVGMSQIAISAFVLRLEKTHLFSKVSVNTHADTYLGAEVVAFDIDCPLDTHSKGAAR